MGLNLKVYSELFKELVRPIVHPHFHRANKAVFEERKKFYGSFLRPNDLVFDVGANLGNRVEVFLAIGCKVIAIEPQAYCKEFLKAKFGKEISLLPIALGQKKEQLHIHINSNSSTLSSLSTEWISAMKNSRFKEGNWNKTELVNVDTLDNLVKDFGLPAFVKIDVEGFELEVLKGLSTAVPMLCIEYTTPEQTQKLLDCLNRLSAVNPNYVCNFSVGESNAFALNVWKPLTEFIVDCVNDVAFLEGFGDIYFKLPKNT